MPTQIRLATEADFPRIVAVLNTMNREQVRLEDVLRVERNRPATDIYQYRVAEIDGRVVGYALAEHDSTQPEGQFLIRNRVEAPYRRQGLGQALLTQITGWAREQGATRFETNVWENDAETMAWAERRGWRPSFKLFESTIDLPGWDPAPFSESIERLQTEGIRFTDLGAEGADEAGLRRYYDLIVHLNRDVPVFGERPLWPFEQWRDVVTGAPHYDPSLLALAAHGDRWMALAFHEEMASGGLYHDLTGVDRDYRGRGVALALKAWALTRAKEKGYPYARTNNHTANGPMLAVNRKLGYVPAPALCWFSLEA